ncbi:MAG TPA: phosphoadenylyl-sulfate reductase [Acidobacteriota bacterium]|nr:phosphoadenylyl-sulfate reductase [Acidobacteriota bacterium]
MKQASNLKVVEQAVMDDYEAGELAALYEVEEPEIILEWAFERFGTERFALISSFQIEAVVLIDMAWRVRPDFRVVTVDTGRMPQETFELIERVGERYDIPIEVVVPDSRLVQRMVARDGVNLFFRSVPKRLLCCHIRKVVPLIGVLDQLDAWATGLRRDQWATRGNIRKIDIDHDHGGIVKISPLADWDEKAVWDYIRDNDVPYHALYDRGYTSIGCTPCTRQVHDGEDARSGRWWWEKGAPKECGMHCPVETGGFEHEVESILGEEAENFVNFSD